MPMKTRYGDSINTDASSTTGWIGRGLWSRDEPARIEDVVV